MFADLLRRDFELSPLQLAALEAHFELMRRWNRVLNLTAIERPEEAVERHYCESLFLGMQLPSGRLRVADIGSGAGFPGFPVAVLRADVHVTLIESHQRKAVFLREAGRALKNLQVLALRAEAVKERFDVAISRAVSYEDLGMSLQSLAGSADLLTGAEEPPERLGFVWQAPIRLPWGKQRFLRKGCVSRQA